MASDYPEPPALLSESQGRPGATDDRAGFSLALASHSHVEGTSTEPEEHVDPEIEIKRPRACEPCRQLKVRCDPDPTHPDGACKRCAKARRQCIVTAPSRKRQKKTDSRVTELERKIDALTATLQASHQPQIAEGGSAQAQPEQSSRRWLREDAHLAGSKRHHDGFLVSQYSRPDSPSAEQIHKPSPASKHWRGPYAGETTPGSKGARNDFTDVIDRGLIDINTAQLCFNRYVNLMAEEMPFVVFPQGTTMGQVRRDKPALFLAILGVSVGAFKKDLQLALINDCYRLIAENVVVKGNKSLDLVQALLVVSIWYIPPDNLEELKFYQMIHMAIALAMDLGLNRRSNGDLKPLTRLREIISKAATGPNIDLNGPEARRTWIGCYFLGIQVATALRRMQLVRWQPYNDESIQILENHADALPSDRKVIWWAKLGWLMEQAGMQLTADDSQSVVSFTDSKVRYTIKAFANQLAQFRRDIPEDMWSTPLAHTYYAIDLFVHESAMGVDCRDGIQPNAPESEKFSATTMAPLIDALTSCINSIHKTLDIITSVNPERFINLPTLAVARTAYPVVSLIKIYSLLTAPESRIGQVIDMQTLKVEYYLDRVITRYRAAAALDGGRVATKFGNIIMMLRNWFVKKKENGPELREIFGAEMASDTPSDKASMKEGTTPLHVLSELAMGDPANRPPTGNLSHRPHSGHDMYSQEFTRNPTTQSQPGATNYEQMGRMASTRSEPSPAAPWPSSTYSPQMPVSGISDPMGNRGYYQTYSPQGQPQYSMPSASASQYDMSMDMPFDPSMGIIPGEPFDPNNLSALGTIMDEGLFAFPFAFDGNFQV